MTKPKYLNTRQTCERYGLDYPVLIKWIERGVYLGAAFHKVGRRWLAEETNIERCTLPGCKEEPKTEAVKVKMTACQKDRLRAAAGGANLATFIRKNFIENL